MNPQTLREGRRVLSIVDDLLEDLAVIQYLPAYFSGFPAGSKQSLLACFHDDETAREVQQQLADHYDLERRIEAAAGSDISPEDVADAHFSTRALVDTLRSVRFGTPSLRLDPSHHPSANVGNLVKVLEVQRGLLADRFNTTVEDDVVKFAILNDTVNREKTASADVQALNREFFNEKESRRVEVEKREGMIRKLKMETQQTTEGFDSETSFFEKASAEVRLSDTERYQGERESLNGKVDLLMQKLQRVQRECAQRELERRQGRSRQETALKQTFDTYDAGMFQVTADIERLEAENKETERQLDQVISELTELNAQATSYANEMELEQRRKEHIGQLKEKLHDYARIIQACFRAHMVRFMSTQKKKKRGGRGGR